MGLFQTGLKLVFQIHPIMSFHSLSELDFTHLTTVARVGGGKCSLDTYTNINGTLLNQALFLKVTHHLYKIRLWFDLVISFFIPQDLF